jgi:leucyl-tRNA synthetase
VNGKIRARIDAQPGLDEEAAFALALAHPGVQANLAGKTPRKRIYVHDKLLNIVV